MSRAFPTRLTIAPPALPTLRPRAARSTTSGVLGRRSATGGNAPLATLSAKNGVSTGVGWAKEGDAVRQNAARAARSAALIPPLRGGIRHPSHKGEEKGAPAIEIPPTITPPPEPRPPSCGLGGRARP